MTSNGSSSSSSAVASFKAKVNEMKSWKPHTAPSNRDRLELYALHKQAASGDAPSITHQQQQLSIPEKSKLQAWQNKRGLLQTDAMKLYITECDRQMRVYGGASSFSSSNALTAKQASTSLASSPALNTPTNTPAANSQSDRNGESSSAPSSSLSPRGLAAIPLLCAAAAESRTSYLERLKSTSQHNGWWARQEPLCADPGTIFAIPESILLAIASLCESLSLSSSSLDIMNMIPSPVFQSFLWPLHNVLLSIWIVLIFICTLLESSSLIIKSLLFGSKRLDVPLQSVFNDEIFASSKLASSLCFPHQAMSIRLSGLALMPLGTLCDITKTILNKSGYVASGVFFVAVNVITWWYWLCVIPWLAFFGIGLSFCSGVCFALIEIAGND